MNESLTVIFGSATLCDSKVLNLNGLGLGRNRLPFFGCYVPRNPLQVQDKNRVKDRDQAQGDEGSDGESADLGIAERFPEPATFESERKQGKYRCAPADHHGPTTLNPGIRKSTP